MKRYDYGYQCDGESGRCRERMVPTEDGDYVLYTAHVATVAALRALAELGRWCLTESRENDCSDVGGDWLQDKAIELGLLAYVTVAAPCGEACACMDYYAGDEWPHDCLRETERAALKGES